MAIVRNDRYLVGGRIAGRLVQPGDEVAPALAQVAVTGAITADIDGGRYAVAASLLGDGARLLIVSPVVSDPGALSTPGLVISWASVVIILLLVTGHFFTRHWQMLRRCRARAAVATHLDAPRPLAERLEAVPAADRRRPGRPRADRDRRRRAARAVRLPRRARPSRRAAAARQGRPARRRGRAAPPPHQGDDGGTDTEEARCGMPSCALAPLLMGSGLRGVVAIADRPGGFLAADRAAALRRRRAAALAGRARPHPVGAHRRGEHRRAHRPAQPPRPSVEHLDRQLAIAERARSPLSVLMLDLDRLKEINDTHGHAAGDEALRVFARTVSSTVRRADLAARISGDEFVIVMANTRGGTPVVVAEKVRIAVASVEVRVGASRTPVRLG